MRRKYRLMRELRRVFIILIRHWSVKQAVRKEDNRKRIFK